MGSLHEGHLSLMARSKMHCDPTVVSIFINPLQFAKNEDYSKYPKPFASDCQMLESLKVDILYAPEPEEFYPKDMSINVHESELSQTLCGPYRAGHFDGVATVVLKLFNLVRPYRAYFGLKDYQQCKVVERMVRDLSVPVLLEFCPTQRDSNGLALSSRNVYLTPKEKENAHFAYATLLKLKTALYTEPTSVSAQVAQSLEELKSHSFVPQYLEVVDRQSLSPLNILKKGQSLIALAVYSGSTRLIDNLEL